MNESERTMLEFLSSLQIGEIQFEPDGQQPPDFLVGGRIAVEVRRLNEHEVLDGHPRSLEVTAKPLHRALLRALSASGSPINGTSWFVHCRLRRPLPPWKTVSRWLSASIQEFRERIDQQPSEVSLGSALRLRFQRSSTRHGQLLVLGSFSDHDTGGFLIDELARNLRICIEKKVQKVARVRHRYQEWWLALEDRIAYGELDDDDLTQLRLEVGAVPDFSRVLLVNPLRPTNAIDLY